jgi:ACS family hexuronate transporter-like MFS transporter
VKRLLNPRALVSRKAWLIICLSQAMVGFFYLDQQNMGVLKEALDRELGVTDQAYGSILSLFLAAYAASYFVTGWLIDRSGVRRMFPFFVGLMSVATLCSGLARNLEQFTVCRVLLGFAQAGVMPASVVALVKWIPVGRRASVVSLTKPIAYAAQIIATPLPILLAAHWSWRLAFLLPGAAGLLVSVLWWCVDRPDDLASPVQAAGWAENIRHSFRQPEIRGLILSRALTDPVWFFILHWQPVYLVERMNFTAGQLARMGWLPTAAKALGGVALALFVDRRIAAGSRPAAIRIRTLQATAVLAPAFAILAWVDKPQVALAVLSLMQIVASAWLTLSTILMADLCTDRTVGSNVALMDGTGILVSSVVAFFTGSLIQEVGYGPIFIACGMAYPLAAYVLQATIMAKHRQQDAGSTTLGKPA